MLWAFVKKSSLTTQNNNSKLNVMEVQRLCLYVPTTPVAKENYNNFMNNKLI